MRVMNLRVTAVIAMVAISACSKAPSVLHNASSSSLGTGGNQGYTQARLSVSIYDPQSQLVYTDANPASSLILKENTDYTFNLQATNAPAGTTYKLYLTNIDLVSQNTVSMNVQEGSNTLSLDMGNYTVKLEATAPGLLPQVKYYQASVTCASPTFTANSLNANAISVSGSNNLYTFSAAGVVASANGMAPYDCAFDITGTGILNTELKPCSQAFSSEYVNYVGPNRHIGLMVRDACNIAVNVEKVSTLNYSEPSMPGNVFIFGKTSAVSSALVNDRRVNGIEYLATNVGGHKVVEPEDYIPGSGKWTLSSSMNYGFASSAPFGMKLVVTGLTDSISPSGGSISAANAKLQSIAYSTDRDGDNAAALKFSGTTCTLSNQGAQLINVSGSPCQSGSGTHYNGTVEVWGHYVCTNVKNALGSMTIEGDFDGFADIADNCSGGGGGGGGIVPIPL